MLRIVILLVFVVLVGVPVTAIAGPATITAVDARTGLISGKESATGRMFQFAVGDANVVSRLHVGQPVNADFTAQVVSLPGTQYRFRLVAASAPGPATLAGPVPAPAPQATGNISAILRTGLGAVLYGRVSTVTGPTAVAVQDPSISSPPLPGKQRNQMQGQIQLHPFANASMPTPALPSQPAIQFSAVPSTLPPPPQDDACSPFLPIYPRPVSKGAVTWVDPSSSTVYFVGLPAVVVQSAAQNPGAQSYNATTCVKLSENGRIDGETHLWTGGSAGGHTAVKVYFVDIHGSTVHETPDGIGGDMWINGCPGGLSFTCSDNDHRYLWHDQLAPTENLGDVVGVSIVQLPTGDSNFLAHLNEVLTPLKTISEIYKNVSGGSGGGGG